MGFRLEVKKKARRLSSDDGPCQKNNPGSDLLSHAVSPRSTIGGRGLNFRVRNGNGCDPSPMTTGKGDREAGEPANAANWRTALQLAGSPVHPFTGFPEF